MNGILIRQVRLAVPSASYAFSAHCVVWRHLSRFYFRAKVYKAEIMSGPSEVMFFLLRKIKESFNQKNKNESWLSSQLHVLPFLMYYFQVLAYYLQLIGTLYLNCAERIKKMMVMCLAYKQFILGGHQHCPWSQGVPFVFLILSSTWQTIWIARGIGWHS